MYKYFLKRLLDLIAASCLFIILLPLFLISFVLVKIDSEGPFLFSQKRLGYKGRIFAIFKIRTMTNKERITNKEIVKGNLEVTKVGAVLRRLKIDELPQLINIILGNMSIVGPRPCLPSQINEFNSDGKARLLVRPGLTGLAQINGNIYLSWPERWKYDCQYVENLCIILDLKIIFKTFLIIFRGEHEYLKKMDA